MSADKYLSIFSHQINGDYCLYVSHLMFMLQISGIEIIEYKRSLQNLTDYYCIPRILVNHMLLEY